MAEGEPVFGIRVANMENACLLALRAKGYHLSLSFTLDRHGDYWPDYKAEKNGRVFSATSAEELLGIVAMWEVRGDDWQTRPDEPNVWDELDKESKTYDSEGNLLEDD